jgi:histidinol dehydrogenase
VTVKRFDVGSWLDSPMSRRRLDLSHFAGERAVVADICAQVATDGDEALRELGKKLDGWAPGMNETFEVPARDLAAAADGVKRTARAEAPHATSEARWALCTGRSSRVPLYGADDRDSRADREGA